MTQETYSFNYKGQAIPTDKAGYLLDYTLWEEDMVRRTEGKEHLDKWDLCLNLEHVAEVCECEKPQERLEEGAV